MDKDIKKPKKVKTKSKSKTSLLEGMYKLDVKGMVKEEIERFKYALKFFKICNQASFEIALSIYSLSGTIVPYTDFLNKFQEEITKIQKSYIKQINEFDEREELEEKQTQKKQKRKEP